MNQSIAEYIADFTTSEYFLFIEAPLKEYAETVLEHFCRHLSFPVSLPELEEKLTSMTRLDLPLTIRKAIPDLVSAYFSYLSSSGKYPAASSLTYDMSLLKQNYLDRIRDNGSVRGITFQKRASETGRNDPCPCGSGSKFKKCCGKLS